LSYEARFRSSGAILLLAMVFLVLLALLGITSIQSSILEFRMAGNEMFKEDALQTVHGIADSIADDSTNFTASKGMGYTICKMGLLVGNCDSDIFVVEAFSRGKVADGTTLSYQVQRMEPLLLDSLPLRELQHRVSSSLAFDVAIFEIRVEIDSQEVGLGQAKIVQGVANLVSSSTGAAAE